MERRQLGHSGLDVPVVGLGTYRVFNVRDDEGEQRCEAVVSAALDQPGTLIDSSPMYGEAERVLALALAGRRDRAVVATKVWARTRAVGETQIEQALEWFERVDVYQVHNMLRFHDHLPYLEHLKQGGRIGAIGATHYLASEMKTLADVIEAGLVDMVQVPYNPRSTHIEAELLPAAARLGVGVVAMMPFATGQLLARPPADREIEPLRDFGVHTWPQALLKWALSEPRIHCVIPATSSPSRMSENAAAGSPPWFGSAERALVARLASW